MKGEFLTLFTKRSDKVRNNARLTTRSFETDKGVAGYECKLNANGYSLACSALILVAGKSHKISTLSLSNATN